MADGFLRAPMVHDDAVYLDMPLAEYLRDPALSGSAFKLLLSDPAALTWESDANPLYLPPERAANRPRLRGSAAHCAILEGLDAYEQRYTVKPEGGLESLVDLKRWLSNKRCELVTRSIDGKLSKEDKDAVKQTGDRAELIERIHALDPTVKVWEPDEDVETLHPTDDQYVRLLERFVRLDPVFGPLVSHGLPEVSIFWSEDGLRFKARIDYLTAHTVLDLKTFGRAPRRGNGLRKQCITDAAFNGYDLQAVHNFRAVEVAAQLCAFDNLEINGPLGSGARLNRCAEILREAYHDDLVFRWLFIRMGGAPTGISIPFRESDGQWQEARRQIDDACHTYRDFRKRFGDGELWLVTHGEQEIRDWDWPPAATAEDRRDDGEIDE